MKIATTEQTPGARDGRRSDQLGSNHKRRQATLNRNEIEKHVFLLEAQLWKDFEVRVWCPDAEVGYEQGAVLSPDKVKISLCYYSTTTCIDLEGGESEFVNLI